MCLQDHTCLLYMADKISSCNLRDTLTQRKSNYFFNSAEKAIAGKQAIGTSIFCTYRKVTFVFILSHFLHGIIETFKWEKNWNSDFLTNSLPTTFSKRNWEFLRNPWNILGKSVEFLGIPSFNLVIVILDHHWEKVRKILKFWIPYQLPLVAENFLEILEISYENPWNSLVSQAWIR